MPCRDFYDDHPEAYYGPKLADKDQQIKLLKKQVSFAESALCAALEALERVGGRHGAVYDWIDYPEAGITRDQLVEWHKQHRELDAKHREQERQRQLKASALSKLTDEEKQALGVK